MERTPYTGPGLPYTPPRTVAMARKEIADLRNVIRHSEEYNILRDYSAPDAARTAHAMAQQHAQNILSNYEHDGHGPGEVAVARISAEDAEHRVAHFQKGMIAAGVTGEALTAKVNWFKSTLNVAED